MIIVSQLHRSCCTTKYSSYNKFCTALHAVTLQLTAAAATQHTSGIDGTTRGLSYLESNVLVQLDCNSKAAYSSCAEGNQYQLQQQPCSYITTKYASETLVV
eukprot:14940-Heterococcus_DN1.PRE.1